jgi:hypothetical protein
VSPLRTSSFWYRAALATAFRFLCSLLMLWMLLWAEARPAPSLPDVLLSHVPYVKWLDDHNYLLWLVAYVPLAFAFLFKAPERFLKYMVTAGMLAVVRGICIASTGLGPVKGQDLHAQMTEQMRANAFWEIASPVGLFARNTGNLYLTKDLFFSGHTSTTFLLLLYVWPYPTLRWIMLVSHLAVVACVALSHLHYTIDILGAYAFTLALFAIRESGFSRIVSPVPAAGLPS